MFLLLEENQLPRCEHTRYKSASDSCTVQVPGNSSHIDKYNLRLNREIYE
jgi:hypothetical protein